MPRCRGPWNLWIFIKMQLAHLKVDSFVCDKYSYDVLGKRKNFVGKSVLQVTRLMPSWNGQQQMGRGVRDAKGKIFFFSSFFFSPEERRIVLDDEWIRVRPINKDAYLDPSRNLNCLSVIDICRDSFCSQPAPPLFSSFPFSSTSTHPSTRHSIKAPPIFHLAHLHAFPPPIQLSPFLSLFSYPRGSTILQIRLLLSTTLSTQYEFEYPYDIKYNLF